VTGQNHQNGPDRESKKADHTREDREPRQFDALAPDGQSEQDHRCIAGGDIQRPDQVEQHIDVLQAQPHQNCPQAGDSQKDQSPRRQTPLRPYRAREEKSDKNKDAGQDESRIHHRVKR
jgi:hypothetical protein